MPPLNDDSPSSTPVDSTINRIAEPAKWLVTLNFLALLLFVAFALQSEWLSPSAASMRYTELDRAQVINQGKLRESFPQFASNDRFLVGRFIAAPALESERNNAIWGGVFSVVNLLLIGIILESCRDQRRALASQSSSKLNPSD